MTIPVCPLPRTIIAGFWLLVPLAGCAESLTSDNGVVSIDFPDAHGLANRVVVVGTRLCPDVITDVASNETVTDCYTIQPDAAWQVASGCYDALAVGNAALNLAPQDCTVADAPFTAQPDSLSVDVLAAADATASVQWLEEVPDENGFTMTTPIPGGIVPADGDPIRVATGASMLLTPELQRTADGETVGWGSPNLGVTVDGQGVAASYATTNGSTNVPISVASGASATLIWTDGASSWPLTAVVADEGPFTLSSVYVGVVDDQNGVTVPIGARAVVLDAAGEIAFGAPVTWTSDILDLKQGVTDSMPSSDYAELSDDCRDPNTLSGEQHATLTATLGDQTITSDVVWTPAPGDGSPWAPAATCPGASPVSGPDCGCATTSTGAVNVAAALVAGLALLRRRR